MKRRITPEDVETLRAMRADGQPLQAIAERLGRSEAAVRRMIVNYKIAPKVPLVWTPARLTELYRHKRQGLSLAKAAHAMGVTPGAARSAWGRMRITLMGRGITVPRLPVTRGGRPPVPQDVRKMCLDAIASGMSARRAAIAHGQYASTVCSWVRKARSENHA